MQNRLGVTRLIVLSTVALSVSCDRATPTLLRQQLLADFLDSPLERRTIDLTSYMQVARGASAFDGTARALLGPPRSVPLLVTNTTCTPGPCQAIRILAFPTKQFRTPGPFWSFTLGTITGATGCLRIPPTAIHSISDAGLGRTVVVRTWTSRDSLALGASAPSEPRPMESPSTEWFVPQRARAWQVALPGSALPKPAHACVK
jgi:hypothetical protein